jgi:predicted nucleotidyltransferase
MLKAAFDRRVRRIVPAAHKTYGVRLVSVVFYGSVARGTMRHDSAVDLLIVARDLPAGRMKRVSEFEAAEKAVAEDIGLAASYGIHTTLSPVCRRPRKSRPEACRLSLDMVEDARVLYDQAGVFAQQLARLRQRLVERGAKRVRKGNVRYWDLKPDCRPGEVFEL